MTKENTGKILVTAFEPFGISGAITGRNTSLEILKRIQSLNFNDCEFLILPVDGTAAEKLQQKLNQMDDVKAVLSLGQEINVRPDTIRIEPHANPKFSLKNIFTTQTKIESAFVEETYGENLKSGIGNFRCNEVYRAALEHEKELPACFIHTPVIGDLEKPTRDTVDVLNKIREHIPSKMIS